MNAVGTALGINKGGNADPTTTKKDDTETATTEDENVNEDGAGPSTTGTTYKYIYCCIKIFKWLETISLMSLSKIFHLYCDIQRKPPTCHKSLTN